MRPYISFFAAVLAFAASYFLLKSFLDLVGAETYVDFGETITLSRGSGRDREYYESDGEGTDLRLAIILMSLLVSARGYHMCLSGKRTGDFAPKNEIQWRCWLLGLGSFVLLTAPLYQHLPNPHYLIYKVIIGIACARVFFLRNQRQIEELNQFQSKDQPGDSY